MKQFFNWVMVVGLILLITGLIILDSYLDDENVSNAFHEGYEKSQTEISRQDSALYKVAYHEGWIDALNAGDTTIIYIDSVFTHKYFYIEIRKD